MVKYLVNYVEYDIYNLKSICTIFFNGILKLIFVFENILQWACLSDNIELVKFLISKNYFNVKAKDIFLDFFFK